MSDSQQEPWSDNPNAPQIPYSLYINEKDNFAGVFIGTICCGIVVSLFFQCMCALFAPVNRAGAGVKWVLVAHTVIMFSLYMVATALGLDLQSISYIDDRAFPGNDAIPPGPLTYQLLVTQSEAISITPAVVFLLNQWLADGLLLYRCYIIYAMNHWVMAFPCLVYLATFAMGVAFICLTLVPRSTVAFTPVSINIGVAFFSISVSLNVLLTLMIVIRLALHSKNIKNALGAKGGASGLYNAVITMLVESCALYAVAFVIYIGFWRAHKPLEYVFFEILSEAQIIAPFLVTLRVANRTSLTSETIVSGKIGSIHFGSGRELSGGDETFPDGDTTASVDPHGETPSGHGIGAGTGIDEVPL